MKELKRRNGISAKRLVHAAFCVSILTICLAACASRKPYTVELMTAPEVFAKSVVDPFYEVENMEERVAWQGTLYATDCQPSAKKDLFYDNKRGFLVRLGIAEIALAGKELDWEEARRVSLLKNRSKKYPLKVAEVREFGILNRSASELIDPDLLPPDLETPAKRFADLIDQKLEKSRLKEIFIYVHGYKVVFDNLRRNPSLVLIDVTNAESAAAGNGHAYFRKSPWVSSDILISLLHGLGPEKRGLEKLPNQAVWHFPEDYNHRLEALLDESLPTE